MRYLLILAILVLAIGSVRSYSAESDYAIPFCKSIGGIVEVVLFDRTRVDCLTAKEAIEVDFASKWAEAIGQALYYAEILDKKPAVMLIVKQGEARFVARFHNATMNTPIKLYILTID